FLLAGKVVEERSLGQAGLFDDAVQAAALKAVAVELLKGGPKNQLPCRFRGMRFVHAFMIPTSWYVVKGLSSGHAQELLPRRRRPACSVSSESAHVCLTASVSGSRRSRKRFRKALPASWGTGKRDAARFASWIFPQTSCVPFSGQTSCVPFSGLGVRAGRARAPTGTRLHQPTSAIDLQHP